MTDSPADIASFQAPLLAQWTLCRLAFIHSPVLRKPRIVLVRLGTDKPEFGDF
jgi:hypothetical protein